MRKGLNCSHIEPLEALNIWKFLWNVRACLYLVPDRNTDHRWIFYPSFLNAVKKVLPEPINQKAPGHMAVIYRVYAKNCCHALTLPTCVITSDRLAKKPMIVILPYLVITD